MIVNGPVAPKDPEKKRPYFYIMKDYHLVMIENLSCFLLIITGFFSKNLSYIISKVNKLT